MCGTDFPLRCRSFFSDEGADPGFEVNLDRLGEFLVLATESVSVAKVAGDSLDVDCDAIPESRRTSECLELTVPLSTVGSSSTCDSDMASGRSNGWMPKRAEEGGGGATQMGIGGLPALISS